jgi:hypothetical protein
MKLKTQEKAIKDLQDERNKKLETTKIHLSARPYVAVIEKLNQFK